MALKDHAHPIVYAGKNDDPNVTDKFSLKYVSALGADLPNWGQSPGWARIYLEVLFEGELIYRHPAYDDMAPGPLGEDGIAFSDFFVPNMSTFIPLVQGVGGVPEEGKYVMNVRYLYLNSSAVAVQVFQEYTFDYKNADMTPSLGYHYDLDAPTLDVYDTKDYRFLGVSPSFWGSFVLNPPLGKPKTTIEGNDTTRVRFYSFYTGTSVVVYSAKATYVFTDYQLVCNKTTSLDVEVHSLDWCAIGKCYERLLGDCGCSDEATITEVTRLISLLKLQVGCPGVAYSKTLNRLMDLMGCAASDGKSALVQPCVKAADTPQYLEISTSPLVIDFSLGSVVFIDFLDDCHLRCTGVGVGREYKIFMRNSSGASGSVDIQFNSQSFTSPDGALDDALLVDGAGYSAFVFYGTSEGLPITLVSRNDLI